jgi:hypothetical protein
MALEVERFMFDCCNTGFPWLAEKVSWRAQPVPVRKKGIDSLDMRARDMIQEPTALVTIVH